MKNVKNLVSNFQQGQIQQPGQHQLQNSIPPVVKQLVDQVFKQLKIICPGYSHSLPTEQAINDCKKEWVKAFYENNINQVGLVKAGLVGARRHESDFMPSCGKFISWCKQSPESKGWPSADECLRECVKYRNNKKLFGDKAPACRPLFSELIKRVDWWLMNQSDQKKAMAHFNEEYTKLVNSNYVEPQATEDLRLPTQETVNAGLSEKQKADKEARKKSHIEEVRAKLKRKKYSCNSLNHYKGKDNV